MCGLMAWSVNMGHCECKVARKAKAKSRDARFGGDLLLPKQLPPTVINSEGLK